ncbi:MAG: hypothetical protein U5L11_12835 [Arhodomonas sp.]|nr:hypothetical protein [Arhodomonas sp.]
MALPLALLAVHVPTYAPFAVALAYLPLLAVAWRLGVGFRPR